MSSGSPIVMPRISVIIAAEAGEKTAPTLFGRTGVFPCMFLQVPKPAHVRFPGIFVG